MKNGKKKYTSPKVTKQKVDSEISMVMMTFGPGGDPGGSIFRGANILKWLR